MPAIVNGPIRQALGAGPHVVRRQGHRQKITGDHQDDHQHGGQDRLPGHDQAYR
jgi:hypothetical protein